MEYTKRVRLERAGWKVGSVQDFLQLSDADAAYVEIKARLAHDLLKRRAQRRYTQEQVAKLLGSSQSRVAKMEVADGSVSLDLLVRSLLALGTTPSEIARAIRRGASPSARRLRRKKQQPESARRGR